MLRPILMTAFLTGVFCAGFAMFIDWATEMLMQNQVIAISFVSGTLGSLFAQTVLGRWRDKR
ncbi:hypothetical protein GQ651_07025 [Alphaproteobacteria bacterium GH1-50]|uniref:Uncharacterized protein n=1 Tax=Kangsaoukella pontilimi TaxID=2691042 RepID=A0A7C9MJA3_9RHOB|nr:hypothetical protein [Kangsaoukella pontilimi]MXQ07595.1 hypothetical protein [Kangsaoukella pontilimi]